MKRNGLDEGRETPFGTSYTQKSEASAQSAGLDNQNEWVVLVNQCSCSTSLSPFPVGKTLPAWTAIKSYPRGWLIGEGAQPDFFSPREQTRAVLQPDHALQLVFTAETRPGRACSLSFLEVTAMMATAMVVVAIVLVWCGGDKNAKEEEKRKKCCSWSRLLPNVIRINGPIFLLVSRGIIYHVSYRH